MQESSATTPPPKASRGREWLLRLVLVGGALVFTLALLEGAVRILAAQGGGKEQAEGDLYMGYDPLLGWAMRPGADIQYARREYHTRVVINGRGLRDPERSLNPPPGTFRVLALGDSFTEGYTVEADQTAVATIEKDLNEHGCVAEVINAGRSGYSTQQEALFYVSDGARYRAGLVIVFLYYNDLVYSDLQAYNGTPIPAFETPGGVLRLHRFPVARRPPPPAGAAGGAEDAPRSYAVEWLRDRLWYGAPQIHDAVAKLGLWNPIPRSEPRLELRVYEKRTIPEIEGAWTKVEQILRWLRERVSTMGGRLALVYIPNKMEVQESAWRLTKQLYKLDEIFWDPSLVASRVEDVARRIEIPLLDLNGALRGAETALRPTYFRVDGHWNAHGHAVAGRAVGQWLRETKLVGDSCGGTSPSAARRGDLWMPQPGTSIELPGAAESALVR